MTKYEFFVAGKPHGKDRPRLCMQKGRDGRQRPVVYTPAETRHFEEYAFQCFFSQNAGFHTLAGPVKLDVAAVYRADPNDPDGPEKERKGAPAYNAKAVGYKKSKDTKKPDLDNVVKIISDSIQGTHAAIADDTQVVEITSRSIYGPRQGVKVVITALTEE